MDIPIFRCFVSTAALLVNPGSVGMPFREFAFGRGSNRLAHAEYAMVEGKTAVTVTLHRVALDRAQRFGQRPQRRTTAQNATARELQVDNRTKAPTHLGQSSDGPENATTWLAVGDAVFFVWVLG